MTRVPGPRAFDTARGRDKQDGNEPTLSRPIRSELLVAKEIPLYSCVPERGNSLRKTHRLEFFVSRCKLVPHEVGVLVLIQCALETPVVGRAADHDVADARRCQCYRCDGRCHQSWNGGGPLCALAPRNLWCQALSAFLTCFRREATCTRSLR